MHAWTYIAICMMIAGIHVSIASIQTTTICTYVKCLIFLMGMHALAMSFIDFWLIAIVNYISFIQIVTAINLMYFATI